MKGLMVIRAVLGAMVYGIAHASSSKSSSSSVSSAPAAKAHITMLHGPSSDNSCEENDGDARIYVSITLRNTGDAAGTVNPWAAFDYSDGGNSTESYFDDYGHEMTVPAHSERDATFYHTFNPQQHSMMIRCAGYAIDLNSNGSGYYLPSSLG